MCSVVYLKRVRKRNDHERSSERKCLARRGRPWLAGVLGGSQEVTASLITFLGMSWLVGWTKIQCLPAKN